MAVAGISTRGETARTELLLGGGQMRKLIVTEYLTLLTLFFGVFHHKDVNNFLH
jgi:hypothetical protein